MREARESGRNGIGQQQLDAITVHDMRGAHADGQYKAFGVDEQMALAPLDLLALLAAVVAAHAADAGRLDRLAVNDPSAGRWMAPQSHPQPLAQHLVDPLPGAVAAP